MLFMAANVTFLSSGLRISIPNVNSYVFLSLRNKEPSL